jgi:hypothetical protein
VCKREKDSKEKHPSRPHESIAYVELHGIEHFFVTEYHCGFDSNMNTTISHTSGVVMDAPTKTNCATKISNATGSVDLHGAGRTTDTRGSTFLASHTFYHPFNIVSGVFWKRHDANTTKIKEIAQVTLTKTTTGAISDDRDESDDKDKRNNESKRVLAADILNRCIDGQGRLITTRIIVGSTPVPAFISKALRIFAPSVAPANFFAVEVTAVDPIAQTMVIKTQNITGADTLLRVNETCTYKGQGLQTTYTQHVHIRALLTWGATRWEEAILSGIQQSSKQTLRATEQQCENAANAADAANVTNVADAVAVAVPNGPTGLNI